MKTRNKLIPGVIYRKIEDMDAEYLTVEQVAEKLQLHARTVRRMLVAGALPGRKMGPKTWRVPAVALREFMAGGNVRPSAPPEGHQ